MKLQEQIKKDLVGIFLLFCALVLIYKIVFHSEAFTVILVSVLAIFWLFIIPGFSLTFLWLDRFDFLERLALGIVLSAAILGVFSYMLGIAGLHVKYHVYVIPTATLAIGVILLNRKNKSAGRVMES